MSNFDDDHMTFVIGMVLCAAVMGGIIFAGDSCSKRAHAARIECLKQGRIWFDNQNLCLGDSKK